MAEFLPLCDVLFNVISLAGYFCDVVFDVVMGYALLERGYKATFAAVISIILTSLLISQVLSLRWYLHMWWEDSAHKGRCPWAGVAVHCLQLGVLWRYARLLAPLERARVKHQVSQLCMLRLVHAFCEAAPMLLLQLHILFKDGTWETSSELGASIEPSIDEPAANKAFAELGVISASLSLFSVCWALASFSKNVRARDVHRLVLTWLGVIFQFLWRLGTVSARVCALTVYALVYEYWVFLVIGLHWVSMFLWAISPRHLFHGERMSVVRKAYLSALVAVIYVFAYVNLHHHTHKAKMVTFYVVMSVENSVLIGAWWWSGGARRASALPTIAPFAFLAGLAAMLLYYRYFHVSRLGYLLGENQQGTNSTNASSQNKNGKSSIPPDNAIPGVFNCRFANPVNAGNARKKKKPTTFVPPPAAAPAPAFWRRPLPAPHNHHGGSSENEGSSVGSRVNIQQKLQEKKQKQLAELRVIEEEIKQGKLAKTTPVAVEEIYSSLQRQPIPRSKTHVEPPTWPSVDLSHPYQNYPILHNCNMYPTYTEIKSDFNVNFQNSDSVIRNYVQDRTVYENPAIVRSDVRPLRSTNYLAVIGENRSFETARESPRAVLNKSPRAYLPENTNYETTPAEPRAAANNANLYAASLHGVRATHTRDTSAVTYPEESGCNYSENCDRMFACGERRPVRCRTPEILLAPRYLQPPQMACCHLHAPYTNRKKEECVGASSGDEAADAPRAHSDIDSQISLPRSYTLPREFRYWRRRPRLRDRVPSNNSSDGDVDSGDNESDERSNCSAGSQLQSPSYTDLPYQPENRYNDNVYDRRRRMQFRNQHKHETKL